MIVKQKFIPTFKKIALAATAVFGLMQCSEEEIIPTEARDTEIKSAAVNTKAVSNLSLTVTGINTAFAKAKDCSTCTYVVPANTSVVNAEELGIKPGDIICLNSALNYGDLEIINVEGSAEKPVIITTVGGSTEKNTTVEDATEVENAY